ncbi:bifunctional folylpolyglutamate synthase/dihydrofolate synthase [Lachnospiraceae bacterium OttesenSCG-928-D06]|nr:bifunctional folylpolyglutamate synthase/dihydrofolate synthase [Lachnospiraceae bacterium OttesenSCG-928-D06]
MEKQEINTFTQAVEYLYGMPKFTAKNTLEDTRRFLKRLGNPDEKMPMIHVAGTNGKGSVCAYLRNLLEESGKKVAVFTSPHLVDIRERFYVDGNMISKEEFMDGFQTIYNRLDWQALETGRGYHPTFFEYLFLMAMIIFKEKNVDYCILETGLGGRLDSTNAVSNKLLTIITKIGYDHEEYLGETLQEIALEKAGIIREGIPVVYFEDDIGTSSKIIREKAIELHSKTFPLSKNDYVFLKFKNKTIDFSFQSSYYGYIPLSLQTIALYQMENAALALLAFEVLLAEEIKGDRRITTQMIKNGIEKAFWPGRMEEVLPEVYVDGAHNEDGIAAFLNTVKADKKDGHRKLLFSVVSDKNYEKMLKQILLSGYFSNIALASMETARMAPVKRLEGIIQEYTIDNYSIYEDVGTAVSALLENQGEDRIYMVGSLYLVGEIKEYLKHDKF